MAEQRYQAVLAVVSDGETVTDVAARFGVRRQTVHEWLAKYEVGGLEGLADGSHRPRSCPHQMSGAVEVALAEMRRAASDVGSASDRLRAGQEGRRPTSVGVGGVPGTEAAELDRHGWSAAAGPQVAAVGAWGADGVVADGCGGRVRAG